MRKRGQRSTRWLDSYRLIVHGIIKLLWNKNVLLLLRQVVTRIPIVNHLKCDIIWMKYRSVVGPSFSHVNLCIATRCQLIMGPGTLQQKRVHELDQCFIFNLLNGFAICCNIKQSLSNKYALCSWCSHNSSERYSATFHIGYQLNEICEL